MNSYKYIPQDKWDKEIKKPDWYTKIIPEIKTAQEALMAGKRKFLLEGKEELYSYFEHALKNEAIVIGTDGEDWDSERAPIDTIVIHHTAGEPGLTPDRLSAMELVRLYGPYYAFPTDECDKHIHGKLVWSNHIRDGKQVFWPYHWIVRTNGEIERLLEDNETGWHSGRWEVNCRSIGIALDNTYETTRPSERELQAIAKIIRERYSHVLSENIIGHSTVNIKTTCPGKWFYEGGKEELLSYINQA